MRLKLAALGWIPDFPTGNRLRWHYPEQAPDGGGGFLGFPDIIVVERAPIEVQHGRTATLVLPAAYTAAGFFPTWQSHGTVSLTGFAIPIVYSLPSPVQALYFTYRGFPGRLQVKDSDTGQVVADRLIVDGAPIYLEAPSMDELVFLTPFAVQLEDFHTLDTYTDPGLPWEPVAEIGVIATSSIPLSDASHRYGGAASLSATEWDELVQLAEAAQSSTPATLVSEDPTPWQRFQVTLGIRWEFALLHGHGFCDGPRTNAASPDHLHASVLRDFPTSAYAYRIREKAGRVGSSNIVVCPNWPAAPLMPPGTPLYVDPAVRLAETGLFEASLTMRWQQNDVRALGVEIEEEVGASLALGTAASLESFQNRARRAEDPPTQGETRRVFDVPFHDVALRARARATDAWDRVSAYSAWTPSTPLALHHAPQAPSLASAWYDAGTVYIQRQMSSPGIPDWTADLIVRRAAGQVVVYRKTNAPRDEVWTATMPVLAGETVYKTTIPGVVNAADFRRGSLVAGALKTTIAAISGDDFFFNAPDEGSGTITLFDAGNVTLQQDPKHVNLWTPVAFFAAVGLPQELVFDDPVPDPDEIADVLSYDVRVLFLGQVGPASNIVQAIRIPAVPVVPPPFTIAFLGVDFYNRTLVKIRLTTPVSNGRYSVAWADGLYADSTQFAAHATPGEYVAQRPQNGQLLYDVLALPIPRGESRQVMIGVQRVKRGGSQSNFTSVPITLIPVP